MGVRIDQSGNRTGASCLVQVESAFYVWDSMKLFEVLQQRRGRVLFVCLGNSCRSQMAEAFANAYGNDVMEASSAGVLPASRVSRRTRTVMDEKKVPLGEKCAPKALSSFDLNSFDLIVNLSEYGMPVTETMVLKFPLPDPIRQQADVHREVRDKIEALVRFLAGHFRVAKEWGTAKPLDSANALYSERCAVAMSSR
jgi:arsenate reductase